MNAYAYLSSIYLISAIAACSNPTIKLSADFDHGSLGEMVEIKPGYFKGSTRHWLKRDGIGDQYYWFYFNADHVKGRKITLELNELVGVYRGGQHLVYTDYTRPVYSYDRENWQRIADVSYDSATHTFVFTHTFTSEPVWIAYAHPYPLQKLENFVSGLSGNRWVNMVELGRSEEGRSIDMLTITDPAVPDAGKKTILLMAMQHAGEDAGTYLIEGLVDFLISDGDKADAARKNFIYKVVPIMNPDGVFHGTSRYNLAMEDLNNIWVNDDLAQPEVTSVKSWTEAWFAEGKTIDLFIDVHNHSQFNTRNVFLFIADSLDNFGQVIGAQWPISYGKAEFMGSSCTWFHKKGIPCGTIELSQSYVEEKEYLTVDDYHQYGEGTVKAISEYFNSL